MAQLKVKEFVLTQTQLDQLANDVKDVVIQISYDDSTTPGGFKVMATGPLDSLVVCPRPCPTVSII